MSRKVASPDDPTRDAEAVVELVLATWRGLLARGCASADTPSLTPALRALPEAQGSPSSEAHAVTALRPWAGVQLRTEVTEIAARVVGTTAPLWRPQSHRETAVLGKGGRVRLSLGGWIIYKRNT